MTVLQYNIGESFMDIIGLPTHDKRVVNLLSSLGIKPNDKFDDKPAYAAKTIFNRGVFFINKSSKAQHRRWNYISEIIIFRETRKAQVPFEIKWTDTVNTIEVKLKYAGAIRQDLPINKYKGKTWMLNKGGKNYFFMVDFETDNNGIKTIYSYYLIAPLESYPVKNIGLLYHDVYWGVKEKINVAWCDFSVELLLEDHETLFTKENSTFIKSILNNTALKNEFENLLFEDYKNCEIREIVDKYASDIGSFKDSWILIKKGWAQIIIKSNRTINIRFNHKAYYDYDFGIEISGNIGSLQLESYRQRK